MEAGSQTSARPRSSARVGQLIAALRPREWTKNAFVLAPLIFSGKLSDGDAVLAASGAAAAFCAMASAGYLLNDVHDAERDRQHPTKRFRPVASGAVAPSTALALAAVLGVGAVAASAAMSLPLAGLVLAYGAATAAYSLRLKHIVIVDVMTISGLFLLRVYAGSVAIDVTASEWLVFCTAAFALFLAFTKRRQEAIAEDTPGFASRPVLEHYSVPFLDQMVSMVTASAVIGYSLYAVEAPTADSGMLATVPCVLYGMFRYLYLIYHRGDLRDASVIVLADPGIRVAVVLWAVVAATVVLAS